MSFSPEIEAKRQIPQPRKPYVAPVAPLLSLRNRAGKLLLACKTFEFSDIVRQALSESIDLRGAELRAHVYNYLGLEHVKGWLTDIDFSGRDLTRVNFKKNIVLRCNFTDCNLYGATLNGYFHQCDFTGAKIQRVTVYEDPPDSGTFATSFNGKLFSDCILSDVRFDDKTYRAFKALGYAALSKEDFYDDASDYQDDEPTDFGDASNYDE